MSRSVNKRILGIAEYLYTPYSPQFVTLAVRPQRPFRPTHLIMTPTHGIDVCQIAIGVNSQMESADPVPAEMFDLPRNLDADKIATLFAADFRSRPQPDWILEPDALGVRLALETCRPGQDIWIQLRFRHKLEGATSVVVRGAFLGEELDS